MRQKLAAWVAVAAVMMLAAVAMPAWAAPPAAGDAAWANALQPEGASVTLTLARDGTPACDILLPAAPTPQEGRAADELALWLGQMTGATFTVRVEPLGAGAPRPVLSVGRTQRRQAAGLAQMDADLGPEGYAIAASGGDLFLGGGAARGPLAAALALLEEDLGCRWYAAGVARIPPALEARVVPRRYTPAFALRDPFSFVSNDAEWALRNRVNAYGAAVPDELGGHLDYAPGWFVHTFERILAGSDSNLAACPECFMLDADGTRSLRQLCPTHPRVVALAIERVRQVLAQHPDVELVDVSQNDIRGHCHCDRCAALNGPEGTPAAAQLSLVNAVARAVADDHPGVTITTLGYQDTVPATRSLRPASNVAIRLATDVTWDKPFASAATSAAFTEALLGWERVAGRIHIWDYQVNFGDYFQPWPSFHAKAENLRLFAQHHVTGVMIQGAYQGPGNERQAMRAWVFAKLLWDPSRQVWPLMQDFVRGYYGPAAPPLEAYERALYECGVKGQGVVDCMGAETFVATATAQFDDAEARARAALDDELLARVELARLPVLDMALPLARGRWLTSQSDAASPSDADLRVYTQMLDTFARVARRAGAAQYSEGMRLDDWLEQRRGFVSPPTPASQREAEVDGQPVCVYRLPATWRLQRDADGSGQARGWHAAHADEAGWGGYRTDLSVGWEEQGFPGTDGVFWFRAAVDLPQACSGPHVYIFFPACDEEAWVWLDGEPLGERTVASSGMEPQVLWLAPFALEAGGRLTPGAAHSLAVRVHDSGGMGGIYLPVYAVVAAAPLTAAQIAQAVGQRNPYER